MTDEPKRPTRATWLAPLAFRKEEADLEKRLDDALKERRAQLGYAMAKSDFVKQLLVAGLARVAEKGWAGVEHQEGAVDPEQFMAIAAAVTRGILSVEEAAKKLKPTLADAAKAKPPVRASKRPAAARKKDAAG